MKKEQRVWLMGVPSHGQEVIKALQKLGGENVYGLDGERDDGIYFINHEGIISSTIKDETGRLIMDFYREIKLPIQWKDGDILFSEAYNEFAVFEEEYKIDSDKFLSYLGTWHGEYLTHQVIHKRDYRLATKSEVAKFHEFLHKRGKDWDSKNKQLVDWRWKPKDGEKYFYVSSSLYIGDTYNDGCEILDEDRIRFGNCFRTREEAEAAAERVKKALKGE